MKKHYKFLIIVNLYRLIPSYFIFKHNKFKDKLKMDLDAWKRRQEVVYLSDFISYCYFTMTTPEFRTVVLNRLHRNVFKYVFYRIMFKPMETLYFNMPPEKVGGDLFPAWFCNYRCLQRNRKELQYKSTSDYWIQW